MASHQVAIAKASLSAALLKADPASLHREEIAHFHSLLESTITRCTSANVQKCKQWILENIAHSTGRFTALGKYLTVLSSSLADAPSRPGTTARHEPSIKRKRIHILYLLNDILYHAKYRVADASVCSKLQPTLVDLFGSAASFTGCPKHQHKIANLLDLWEEKDYYSREYINKLRETVKNAAEAGSHVEESDTAEEARGAATKAIKSTPYVMPATHGDPSTPWYDLPAGNLMPHIVPNSTRPINPGMIKPLQFVAGPADAALVAAVQGLLDDVKGIFEGEADLDERPHWDIDELGQPIVLDEITGEVIEGEGCYGWSRSFCEKMKRRRKGLDAPDEERDRDRDRALSSRSRSSSRARKRRRYSGSSDGSSPAGQRASHRRRAYSSSRSPSPAGRRGIGDGRSRSRSRSKTYSRSRSRSRSPDSHRRVGTRSFHPPPDRHEGFPPPPPPGPPGPGFIPPPVSSFQNGFNAPFPPPPPNIPYPGQGQQQYGSWPVPPPPPHYSGGPWPPPPPPGNFQQRGYPPPPPPQGGWAPPGQHGGGRGYNGGWNGSNGRGGRGGNRGRGWS